MRTSNLFKSAFYASALAAVTLAGCESKNEPNPEQPGDDGTRWITLTATQSTGSNGAPPTRPNGNGGTFMYGITHEQAIDPAFELDIHQGEDKGHHLTSPRTSRVQVADDGRTVWDIQYTGADGGTLSTYSVHGTNDYRMFGRQVNTAVVLGTSPRWVKSTDEIGVGVRSGSATTEFTGTTVEDAVFKRKVTDVKIALLDLKNPGMANTAQLSLAFPDELASQGYVLGRMDVPLVNKAQNKLFIPVSVSKIDPNVPSLNGKGELQWEEKDNANRAIGTVTLVLDYPSLKNPEFIISKVGKTDNIGYRSKTQHVGTDGHIYQAATSFSEGHQILRISSATNKYDDSYELDLNKALGIDDADIVTFRYVRDGNGVVLYKRGGKGAYLALVDLNAKTATHLATEVEADENFSSIGQYQNIGAAGDYVYVPLTPHSKDGNLYVINWRTKEITKGAKLKGFAWAYYIGAY